MTVRRDDRGETLIELLITIMIIGIGVTAILGALVIAVDASSLNRSQTKVQAALRSWAERLTSTTDSGSYKYVNCASASDFPAPVSSTLPNTYTAQVTRVQLWTGSTWIDKPYPCDSTPTGNDKGAQKVTLTVTAPGTAYVGATQYLDVVVRRPCSTSAAC